MQLRNPFSKETRQLFEDCWHCCWCGTNGVDALHHIMGRVSSSPLNAAVIHNLKCHIGNAALDSFENRSRLLKATLKYLLSIGYRLTDEDKAFKEKYNNYYNS